jgi:hypothetical protein
MNNDDQKLDRLLTRTEEQLTLVKSSAAAGNENPLLPTVETLAETVALLASAVSVEYLFIYPY